MVKYLIAVLCAVVFAVAYAAWADPTPIIIDGHPRCLCDDGQIVASCDLCTL